MRSVLSRSLVLLAASPALLIGQEAEGTRPFMKPDTGLMVWTLAIFAVLMVVLSRYAFGPLTRAVEAREKALQEAIDAAKADRESASKLLAEHRAQIERARDDAQQIIVDSRGTAEKMRQDLLEHTRREQQDLLQRARQEIENEKVKAIVELRREAVDLALAGASKVIEQNLDSTKNRQLVENYLSSLGTLNVSRQ